MQCPICLKISDHKPHPCRFERACSCWYGVPCTPEATP